MSYIYDSFPSYRRALAFVVAVAFAYPKRDVHIFDTTDAANAHDPFPARLAPPVVHVERTDGDEDEDGLEALVRSFNGRYAGT